MFGKRFKGKPLGLKDMLGKEICEGDIIIVGMGYHLIEIVQYDCGGFYPFAIPGWECTPDSSYTTVIGSVYCSSIESLRNEVEKLLSVAEHETFPNKIFLKMKLNDLYKKLQNLNKIEYFERDCSAIQYIQLNDAQKEGK